MLGISNDWIEDCMKWRGEVLSGVYSHWCWDWDGLPIDETCSEFPCACFPTWWSRFKWRLLYGLNKK